MESRVFEMLLKKFKNLQKSKNAQNRYQIVRKCFEHILGYFFRKIFFPSVPWMVASSKYFQKIKKFSKFQKAQNRSQKCPKVFWTCFGVLFSRIFFAQCSMEGRVFEMFSKSRTIFKFSKIAQKCSQKCPNVFWTCFGIIFPKFFLPSFPWRVESSKCFQKIKKLSKFQKRPKSFLNCPKVFWTCFGVLFEKFFCPVFHVGSCLRNVFKKSNFFKIAKIPKSFPKVSKRVLNMFWGNFFEKIFLPSVPWRVESSKCFWKNLKIYKIPKMPKIVPKLCESVLNIFWGSFFENFFAQSSMEGRVFEMFSKSRTILKFSKIAQKCSQKCPNVFWTCFGIIFPKFFCLVFHGGSSLRNVFKKSNNFQIFQKCPKLFPKASQRVLNMFWDNFSEFSCA